MKMYKNFFNKMKRKIIQSVLFISLFISGCLTTEPTYDLPDDVPIKPLKLLTGSDDLHFDAATIVRADMRRDVIELTNRYGGGCEEHIFDLYWDGLFMESNPVQVNLQLSHNSNNDVCRALITEKVFFDLSLLKTSYSAGYQTSQGEIIIHIYEPDSIKTARQTVIYSFNR